MSYLRRRPRCECRALFLRVTAPRQGLNRCTVAWVVRAACDRAGLARVGAHRLRHTAATADAAGRGVAARDRPGASSSRAEDHGDLRQGRPRRAAAAGPPVAHAGRCVMSALRAALDDYLRIRRRLGFDDAPGRAHCSKGSSSSSTGPARSGSPPSWRWPGRGCPSTSIRSPGVSGSRSRAGFARYLATIDPASEVPPTDLLPGHRPRIAPYVYSEQRDRGVDGSRSRAATAAARGPSRDADRAAGRHRLPPRGSRSDSTVTMSTWTTAWCTCAPGKNNKQRRGAAAPEHHQRASRLRRPA